MNILIVGHSLVMREYQYFINLLADRGNRILLITPEEYCESGKQIKVDYQVEGYVHLPLTTVLGKAGKQHFHYYRISDDVKSQIKEFNPDVLYLYEEPCSTVTRQMISLINKIKPDTKKILWTSDNFNRNYISEKGFFDPRGYILENNRRSTYKKSEAIIATTRDSLKVIEEKKYPGRIYLSTTHFINTDFFKPKTSVSNEVFKIGYIGRFVKYKNVEVLINAFSILQKQHKDIELVLVGKGPEEYNYRKILTEKGLEKNVTIKAFIPYPDIPDLFNSFSVFVLPSTDIDGNSEKFGRVVIEAMACKVPVVLSDKGYLPVLGENSGLVFNADSPDDLYSKLKHLYDDEIYRNEIAESGYCKVMEFYTASKIAERLDNIFHDIKKDSESKIVKLGPF